MVRSTGVVLLTALLLMIGVMLITTGASAGNIHEYRSSPAAQ